MKRALILITALVALLAAALLLLFEAREDSKRLAAELAQFQNANKTAILSKQAKLTESAIAAASATASVTSEVVNLTAPMAAYSPEVAASEDSNRAKDWKAQFYLSEIERLVALTPEQSARLLARYKENAPSGQSEEPIKSVLAETLGADLADKFESARQAEEAQKTAEELDQELFTFSRKLSLSAVQETEVRAALVQVKQELKPLNQKVAAAMREAMSNHSGAKTDNTRLRMSYDQLKTLSEQMKTASDTALQQKLKNTLTEQQFNELLAMQASDRSAF